MPENPYTSGSGMKLNTGKMTMQYEMHRAWDEGFAAGRAAAHPAGHIYDGSCPDDTQPDARDPKCPACAAATPDPPTDERRPWPIAPDTVMPPRRQPVRWGSRADDPPTEIHDDPGKTKAYLAGLAAGRTEAAAASPDERLREALRVNALLSEQLEEARRWHLAAVNEKRAAQADAERLFTALDGYIMARITGTDLRDYDDLAERAARAHRALVTDVPGNLDRTVLDPETGIEEPVTTGRIPDAEFVEPPLMPPAASPDERLTREAVEALPRWIAVEQAAGYDPGVNGPGPVMHSAVLLDDVLDLLAAPSHRGDEAAAGTPAAVLNTEPSPGAASPDERLREADPVDVVAEAIYNCREERDPCGDMDDRVHPGEQPRRLPLLWAEVLERGLFPADVDEAYADARRVLAALAAADREAHLEPAPQNDATRAQIVAAKLIADREAPDEETR